MQGRGLHILMLCPFLFHFQVYLMYLLYCPYGVLGVITFPLCPSASTSDSDSNWCFLFHQSTFSHQSLSLLSFISIILKFYTHKKDRTKMTYIYIYVCVCIYMRRERNTTKPVNPGSHKMQQRQDNAFPAPEDKMENVKKESRSNSF